MSDDAQYLFLFLDYYKQSVQEHNWERAMLFLSGIRAQASILISGGY